MCNEIQLRDFDEAGYKADGSGEHAKGRPQGEVCLRGPNVFKGYCESSRVESGRQRALFSLAARRDETRRDETRLTLAARDPLDKREDLTKEALTDDGWCVEFHLHPELATRSDLRPCRTEPPNHIIFIGTGS